jgi:hypothetical protein
MIKALLAAGVVAVLLGIGVQFAQADEQSDGIKENLQYLCYSATHVKQKADNLDFLTWEVDTLTIDGVIVRYTVLPDDKSKGKCVFDVDTDGHLINSVLVK